MPPLHDHARRALAHVAGRSTGDPLDPALRVTLNFHPHFLDRLAEDGVYRSQFTTGTSNGGLTARPGGERWRWESRIFGGAYDAAPAHTRPVYGALDFRNRPFGAAPRFGSAHLRLTAAAVERATFCYPDSFLEPMDFGVASRMRLVALAEADGRDPLDDYVEAQVHGPVVIGRDVEALVLDPSHRGTEVEAAAGLLPCAVEWHGGFRLSVKELRRHPGFRGQEYVELGARIAVDGVLDPRIVQEAAGSGDHDPQDVKKVWHYLARFGAPTA
ncbi:hypothetical protein AQF52_0812 [Streptomyces venezuelae]|uniref:DUF3626 domain-containing protein n=1 Tax=Streptomyces gardneri TaxID=66892 RepID=UPI0006BC5DB7|nr:DUF3626 domain-containing protein [Streptomyces gardneri]ALO06409.1 hypothetical protein AQF52_0812 [Streptomyces venezuelae]QPK43853.1 DUF3626 domain-containing protein [Streptomyces gardneri]WRK35110.1 DUF3626 domain-containing protein [Streptomyces venezuelae]CUM43330.1 hypothetical protein BN2537_15625 [Streptomyces venezuelae]